MRQFSWNPHGLPLNRPFLLHLRISGVLTGVAVYVLFPHESEEKPERRADYGFILNLNNDGVAATTKGDSRVEGFSEIPEILHETLIYRRPTRYAGNPIAQRLREHARSELAKAMEWRVKKAREMGRPDTEQYFQSLIDQRFQMFDPLFENGEYIGD